MYRQTTVSTEKITASILAISFLSFVGLIVFGSPLAGGNLLFGYPYQITGTVIAEPSVRYVRHSQSGQEKVAISLETGPVPTMLAEGYSSGTLILECLSTRCTQIKESETHTFACRGEGRFLEPNVVICKHIRHIRNPQ
jgi:hypothetical protein